MNEEENVMRDSIWSNHVHDFHNKLLFKHDEVGFHLFNLIILFFIYFIDELRN